MRAKLARMPNRAHMSDRRRHPPLLSPLLLACLAGALLATIIGAPRNLSGALWLATGVVAIAFAPRLALEIDWFIEKSLMPSRLTGLRPIAFVLLGAAWFVLGVMLTLKV
jgi:hypothetical protein